MSNSFSINKTNDSMNSKIREDADRILQDLELAVDDTERLQNTHNLR